MAESGSSLQGKNTAAETHNGSVNVVSSDSENGREFTMASKKLRGQKRNRPDKRTRNAAKELAQKMLTQKIRGNVVTDCSFEYESVKAVYTENAFKGFQVTWKPTIEPPCAFLGDPSSLKAHIEAYEDMSDDEVLNDLIKKQKTLDE